MRTIQILLVALAAVNLRAAEDIVFADFEGENYGAWTAAGTAFGSGPAKGTLPGQMAVEGFAGKGLVNSFKDGDKSTGKLTSPEFKIERKFISFLIGGGGFEGKTCMNLLVEGKAARTATGPNTEPGGSERLEGSGWDVSDLAGKTARLAIVDGATGGWGHINIDQIVFTDTKPPMVSKIRSNIKREIAVNQRWLNFPVKNGGKKRVVTIHVDGKVERRFDIELADSAADWMAPLDVSAWKGKTLTVGVNQLPEDSKALESIAQSNEYPAEALYEETLRPQFHFSAKRGWLNDPNGLAFANGEYHLFFQHNPYGWGWGNMHWGHATSTDLVHWKEHGEALYPDELGPMFSGSAVVDEKNTSGFGRDGKAPIVLIYTAAGNPSVQCIAHSVDGRTFTKFSGNPVLKQITPGNRDPKVFWHEPTQKWVMALYVGVGKKGEKNEHTIQFFTSPNLKEWTHASTIDGFFECPDIFELPLDGDAAKKKWVLTAASSDYMIGAFDGQKFTPETGKLKGNFGRGFYAAQTFDHEPKGRRIQIGWLQAPSPGMPFNQCMSLPMELTLRTTAEGPRLARAPVEELKQLRGKKEGFELKVETEGEIEKFLNEGMLLQRAELMEANVEVAIAGGKEVRLELRGVPISYDMAKQELEVDKQRAHVPLRDNKLHFSFFLDRTTFELFANEGLVYIPVPVQKKKGWSFGHRTNGVKFTEVYQLSQAWK